MKLRFPRGRDVVVLLAGCFLCTISAGCSEHATRAHAQPTTKASEEIAATPQPATPGAPDDESIQLVSAAEVENPRSESERSSTEEGVAAADEELSATPEEIVATADVADLPPKAQPIPVPDRTFQVEGPEKALRITYEDLDLEKLIQMAPVTADCVEKMPGWLRNLDGKMVRIRGFMKPTTLQDGIQRFLQVRDTGLCCFGPKGRVHDMIQVVLKPGTTTSYIELRPFDVIGRFRIDVHALEEDGLVYELYRIEDAQIHQLK
ncbi:MAG: hypothetical protein ACKV0T_10350 [Planctomycetales bacterium]